MSKSYLNTETICREYRNHIKGAISPHRIRRQDFEDVMQQVCLEIHRALPGYDPAISDLRTYLMCISWRVAKQFSRRQYKYARKTSAYADEIVHRSVIDPSLNGEQRMIAAEERRFLEEFLDGLPDDRREAFELHIFSEMPQGLIAQLFDVSPGTLQGWLRKTWDELNGALKRRRAKERHITGQILPISAAVLIEREAARRNHVPDEVFERVWAGVQRKLREEQLTAEEEGKYEELTDPEPAPIRPVTPPKPSRFPVKLRLVLGMSGISGATGGLIVWALLHGHPPRDVNPMTLMVMSSSLPNAGALADPPPTSNSTAPWTVIPADLRSEPFPRFLDAASRSMAPVAATPVTAAPLAVPLASRRTGPTPPSAHGVEAEEDLVQTARLALEQGDVETAKAALDHHERKFPNGKLALVRQALRQRLPP